MKFRVTLTDPGVLSDAIRDAVKAMPFGNLDREEVEFLSEHREKKIAEMCGRWFSYGECLTVEIDTDAMTCTVCSGE